MTDNPQGSVDDAIAASLGDQGGEQQQAPNLDDPIAGAAAEMHPVLQQFQGDPTKLADAYGHLQSRFGTQGSEVGALRQRVAELEGQVSQQGNGTPAEGSVAAIAARYKEQQESDGTIDVAAFATDLAQAIAGEQQQQFDQIQAGTRKEQFERAYDAVNAETKGELERHDAIIAALVREQPGLLDQSSPERFAASTRNLLTLARARVQEYQQRQSTKTRVDSGTSRPAPRAPQNGRSSGSAFEEAAAAHRASGSMHDASKMLQAFLSENPKQ